MSKFEEYERDYKQDKVKLVVAVQGLQGMRGGNLQSDHFCRLTPYFCLTASKQQQLKQIESMMQDDTDMVRNSNYSGGSPVIRQLQHLI